MRIESETQAAPRITEADVEGAIASEWYINAGDGVVPDDFQPPVPAKHPLRQVTICVLVLRNGYKLVGVNEGPVSADNFDAEIGRKYARQKAVDQVWPLMGYELRSKLARNALGPHEPPRPFGINPVA
jgi:hypothetical protein